MRILLASPHRYPAVDRQGSGLHPKTYPSGSGYHLHDLLAKGLAEEGHDIAYYLGGGVELPLPAGVTAISTLTNSFDIFHAPIGRSGFAELIQSFAAEHRKACLLTCHMKEEGREGAPNWVFVSRSLAQAHGSARVVLNGIDPADFIFSAVKADYLLFMGAMNKAIDKGLDLALSLSRRKGFRLIVAGTGLNYETIHFVSEICAAAGAEYLGDVRGPRKAELLARARAVLFPSRLHEGCPLVILEAMMSGTPVVSSRSGGAVEIVTQDTGFLCDSDEDWCAAIDQLSDISPELCRQVALQNYHYRRMVKDYLHEYAHEITGS
jgi:glycosyltransferase involved in cell wall biosynthesis